MRENMLSQAEAVELLTDGPWWFRPFDLIGVEPEPEGLRPLRPDWALDLRWQDRTERFIVEFKSPGTPKRLREAAAQVRDYAEASGWQPMVMVPYLDEDALDWFLEQGLSAIDFSGNGVVVVPGTWLVHRTGAPNAYPSSRYIKSVYSGRSSLVGRVMLLCNRFETVTGVRDEIRRRGGRISLATVSKVLQSLEEELLVSRSEGIRLLQPDQLLDRLLASFEGPGVKRTRRLKAGDLGSAKKRIRDLAESQGLELAGAGDAQYTSFPGAARTLSVYTRNLDAVTTALELPETRRFPNLELLETTDELVYFDRRNEGGFIWTSPLQVYLELASGDKRAQEVSLALRPRIVSGELS